MSSQTRMIVCVGLYYFTLDLILTYWSRSKKSTSYLCPASDISTNLKAILCAFNLETVIQWCKHSIECSIYSHITCSSKYPTISRSSNYRYNYAITLRHTIGLIQWLSCYQIEYMLSTLVMIPVLVISSKTKYCIRYTISSDILFISLWLSDTLCSNCNNFSVSASFNSVNIEYIASDSILEVKCQLYVPIQKISVDLICQRNLSSNLLYNLILNLLYLICIMLQCLM